VTEQVKQYFITSPWSKKPSAMARLRIFLGLFAFLVLLYWVLDHFIFRESYGSFDRWFRILLFPTVLSFTYALRFHTLFGWNSLLTVGEDFVERVMFTRYMTVKKRIERHRVRSVSEISLSRFGIRATGLAIRDRDGFASWFFGYIFVPDNVDDYEAIKAKLLAWAPVP
jgi:hypothetical protein